MAEINSMDRKKFEHKLRGQTRHDLLKLATRLKIVGRHRMKKEELVRAIAETKVRQKARRPKASRATRTAIRAKRIPKKNNRALLYPVTKGAISLKAVPPKTGQEDAGFIQIKSPVSTKGQAKAGLVKPGTADYSGIEEKGELPESYGETKVILLPVSPYLIHSQWEVSVKDLAKARLHLGSDYERSRAALRFYDVTDIIFDGSNAHRHFDVEVNFEAKNWYVQLEMPGRSYCVDLGMKAENGIFFPIGRSNVTEIPRGRPSEKTERTYMLVEGDYSRVEQISTFPESIERTVDLTQMAEKVFTPGTSSKQ